MITWIKMLGRDTDYVRTDGNRIVRDDPEVDYPNRRVTVLWSFDTPEDAERNFQAWLEEVIKEQDAKMNHPPVGTWASVAFAMAAHDDSGFDWDAWKDEMKERDM